MDVRRRLKTLQGPTFKLIVFCCLSVLFFVYIPLNEISVYVINDVGRFVNQSSQPSEVQKRPSHPVSQWQMIFRDLYVYSIHYTDSSMQTLEGVIMGDVAEDIWILTYCFCIFQIESNFNRTKSERIRRIIRARLNPFPDDHQDEYRNVSAGRLHCSIPDQITSSWNFVEIKCRHIQRHLKGSVILPLPSEYGPPPTAMSFAHCGPPIFGGYDRPAAVVEFVEYYRLMGVSRFFWYPLAVSNATQAVLDCYEQQGIMELVKWSIPEAVGERIHYFGQLAVIYDCLLKTRRMFDYTIFSDLDEFFVTTKTPATFSSMMEDGNRDCAIFRSAFMEPNAVAFVNYTDLFDAVSGIPVLMTSTITKRDEFVFKDQRTKYICRGRRVDITGVHTVTTMYDRWLDNGTRTAYPDPDTEMLLHFRSDGNFTSSTTGEMRGARLRTLLETQVATVWRKIFPSGKNRQSVFA